MALGAVTTNVTNEHWAQNVPLQTVSRYLGHSDSTVTLQVYAHFILDTQEKVINALDKLF